VGKAMKTKVIIAGTYAEFREYCKANKINPGDALCPSHESHIWGLRDCEVILVGQYWLNRIYKDPSLCHNLERIQQAHK